LNWPEALLAVGDAQAQALVVDPREVGDVERAEVRDHLGRALREVDHHEVVAALQGRQRREAIAVGRERHARVLLEPEEILHGVFARLLGRGDSR
jgi:hypothetical protein